MTRVVKALKWAASPRGRHDITVVIAGVTAIYTSLHRIGVL